MVIVDTNIVIDYLRMRDKSLYEELFEQEKETIGISLITVQELFAGKSTRDRKEEEFLTALLSSLQLLPYTYEVAQLAGEILRDITDPIDFADAAIAATTITNDATLYTKNTKHYQKIKNLELAKEN